MVFFLGSLFMFLPQRIDLYAEALTASERNLAASLRQRYPEGLLDPASVMAAAAGTSAPTVVRFFAKLGYPSMAEVRREARTQLTAALPNPSQRSNFTIGGERSLSECVDDTVLHDLHNVQATFQQLDMAAFQAMVQAICQCQGRIYVVAGENSSPVAMYLTTHLNICRPGVADLGSRAPFPVDRLLWVAPDDVLIAYSIRRYAQDTLQAARYFRECGATVLGICDSMAAPLVRHAQHSLLVSTHNASPFDSYTATFALCNALVSAVAQQLKDDVSQSLQKRDSLWAKMQAQAGAAAGPSPRRSARSKGK